MATTALLRWLPSPALSSPQVFHPLRPSKAMCGVAILQSHLPFQIPCSSGHLTRDTTPATRSRKAERRQCSHFRKEQAGDARELSEENGSRRQLRFAIAMACPVLATALLWPHEASAAATAMAMESGEILLQSAQSAAEIDPNTAKIAAAILGPLFAAFNLMFIVRIVMSWYPQLPVGKFPFVIAYAPTEPVLGPTRRLIPPVGGVDVSPVIWVALMSFLNEILLGQQGLLVLLSQQQP